MINYLWFGFPNHQLHDRVAVHGKKKSTWLWRMNGLRSPSTRHQGFIHGWFDQFQPMFRHLLKQLDKMARMTFMPRKSRSWVIRKGKLTNRFKLLVPGTEIPSIQEKPFRYLEKRYDETLVEKNIYRQVWLARKIPGMDLPARPVAKIDMVALFIKHQICTRQLPATTCILHRNRCRY